MLDNMQPRRVLLEQLDALVAHLLDVYRRMPEPDRMVYDLWTAKDILAHLTFWHESFARNVHDVAAGIRPVPLKGRLGDLNQAGVDAMKPCSLEAVMERLETAHKMVRDHILTPAVVMIPYRKGSRDYTPEEHLEVVIKHITQHLQDVVQASHAC